MQGNKHVAKSDALCYKGYMSKRNGKKPKSIPVHIRLRPKTVSAVDRQAQLHMSTRSRVAGAAIEKVYGV